MANRVNVKLRTVVAVVAVVGVALWAGDWINFGSAEPLVSRGQVFDDATGKPIAGAIVVANYVGGRAWSGSSCNRVESAVSDENGWFAVPLDSRDSPPFFQAYHPEYEHGTKLRLARNVEPARTDRWHVMVVRANQEIDHFEPTIFATQREAIQASGEKRDVYLKRFEGSREERFIELSRLTRATSCAAPPQSTAGLVPFLEAILVEAQRLDAPAGGLASTRWYLGEARKAGERKTPCLYHLKC